MAGWFRLFGSKSKRQDDGDDTANQTSQAFFLDPDDAKTMGDIDYMRTVKTVRKTFPKTAGWGDRFELVEETSALNKASSVDGVSIEPPPAAPTSEPTEAPNFQRRQADSSMDLFRNMAKDLTQ